MFRVRLVGLQHNPKKDGSGEWYLATLKKHDSKTGQPKTKDFFLESKVGAEAVSQGLIEDVDVMVELGFDDFFNATITSMTKATTTKTTATQQTLGV